MINFRKIFITTNFLFKSSAFFRPGQITFKDISQSSYFRPIQKVQQFLNQQKILYEQGQQTFRLRQCVFCSQPHNNNSLNLHTLNVDKKDGKFLCSRCQKRGSWSELKAKLLNIQQNGTKQLVADSTQSAKNPFSQINDTEYSYLMNNLKLPQYADVLEYLTSRGFTMETLEKYKVGAGSQTFVSELGKQIGVHVVYFPMYQMKNIPSSKTNKNDLQTTKDIKNQNNKKVEVNLVKIKVRGASTANKKFTRQFPSSLHSGFFGLNTISQADKTVVITEGQFDAMAAHQQTGYPAISLPQGASSLPDKLIPFLNQFQKIVLWMDNDEAGKLGADKILYKLGAIRTHIVKHDQAGLKDANDFLKSKPNLMKSLIESSKTKPGQNILRYADLKQLVKNRIYKHEQFIGISVDCVPFFNKKVKGIRMQELSIVSGPTGCGKTTFLSQLSLDLAKKDIPVLWGSFEVRNQVLITNMLIQYSGVNLFDKKELFDHYAAQFKNLPIHWLNFHGSNDVDKVLATIQYSIEKHNISFVVLDTLQFMLSDQGQGIKKFDLQDKVMSRLRRIATNYNVHIAIVIHPRKTQVNQDIQIHSIYGTSKAAQQADNIWMIQNRQNFRVFDVRKNRFDGDLGKVALGYDKSLKQFLQLTRSQLLQILHRESSIQEIIENRKNASGQKSVEGNNQGNAEQANYVLEQENQDHYRHDDLINTKRKNVYGRGQDQGERNNSNKYPKSEK